MKKILLLIVIASMLALSLSMTVFAADFETQSTPSNWYTRYNQVQERVATHQIKTEQKKQEVSDFRTAAQEKSALLKATRDENEALLQKINASRKELAKIHADMKAAGLKLDASTLEQISNRSQQIRNIKDDLMASKGLIRSYIESNKDSLKSLDYEVLESMYDDIAEIQSFRNEQLNEINRILNEMLALVQ